MLDPVNKLFFLFFRGGSGPLHVSRTHPGMPSGNPLHEVFIEAGKQAGHAETPDVNGFR